MVRRLYPVHRECQHLTSLEQDVFRLRFCANTLARSPIDIPWPPSMRPFTINGSPQRFPFTTSKITLTSATLTERSLSHLFTEVSVLLRV